MRFAALVAVFACGFLVLLAGVLAARLAWGPIAIEGLSQRVAAALNSRVGDHWRVRVREARVDHAGFNPALSLDDVEVIAPDGERVLLAPQATVAVDPWSLVWGHFRPRAIVFRNISLRLALGPDGAFDLIGAPEGEAVAPLAGAGAGAAPGQGAQAGAAAPQPPRQLTDVLARGVASFIELLTTSDGFLGGIDTARVEKASVVLADSAGRPRFRFTDADLQFSRPKDSLRHFSFALTGGRGPWRLDGVISGRDGERRVASVTFAGVPVSDLLAFGAGEPLVTTDMPLSGSLSGAIDAGGRLTALTAKVNGPRAVIHVDDPDMPRFTMDRFEFEAAWAPQAQRFDILRLFVAWDGCHVAASGALEQGAGEGETWRLRLDSTDALAAPYGPGDAPVRARAVTARLAGVSGGGARIDQFRVETPAGDVSVTGQIGGEAAGDGVYLAIAGAKADVRAAVALWPTFSGRHVRDYIGRTFAAGVVDRFSVQVRMDREAIRRARERLPMTAQELAFEVVMSGAEWRATPDMPPLRADASASGDGASARILVAGGRMTPGDGPALAISNGVVRIDSARRPAMADISFSVAGDLPALLRVMDSAGLGAAPVEPARVRGAARLDVSLKTPLSGSVTAASLQPQAHGALSDVRVARAVGEHDLEGGSFRVDIGAAAAHVAGEARIGGAMVGLDVREARSGAAAGETTVTAVLDDAARARLGFGAGADFSGPVSVVLRFAPEAKASPRVEIDLAKLRISNPVPGWSKAAGRPGRLAFRLDQREGTTRLSDMALEAGNLSASGGSAEIDAKGLQRLRFDVFRMSASDSMRLEAERDGDGYRVTARGRLLDARPALRALLAGEGGAGRGGRAGATASGPGRARIDLDLSAAIVAGFNNEALTNVSLRLTARDGEVRQATVSGSFGAATASLKLAPQRDGETLDVRSGNAGALLRFADIYRRMYGGDVIISAQLGRRAQGGSIDIARFTLRNEPALARIVASQPGRADGINVSEAPFNRLQGTFLRQGGRVQLRDGVIWGPQVGITLAGVVDFARDSTDLAGTFIPAYSVNNAFARIPLLGPLIGGGAREGMFAVSFRITGPASAPTLTVNPLTAVAPGILRKFLEVFTPDGSSRNPAPARPER